MTDDIDWTRLGRYLAGECDTGEAEETRRWLAAEPERERLAEELRAVWNAAASRGPAWDTPAAWRRLAARLHSRERRAGPALVRGGRRAGEGGGRSRKLRAAAFAAAAACVAAGGLWWSLAPHGSTRPAAAAAPLREVRVPMGQRAQFQLTDGTRVLLGPGSLLRYDTAAFGRPTRELQLDGQARFTVSHDPRRPFVVRTARTVTEDLGTEFAITDYAVDPSSEVVVTSGTVAVRSVRADTGRPAAMLRAGDAARLDPDGRTTVRRGEDLRASLAWSEGRLVFADTPVREVVTRVNRWYGGDVRLGHPSLGELRFSATYGAVAESTVVRELATAIGARLRRRGTSTVIVPLSDHPREN